jgi:hypothetical protein
VDWVDILSGVMILGFLCRCCRCSCVRPYGKGYLFERWGRIVVIFIYVYYHTILAIDILYFRLIVPCILDNGFYGPT